MRKIFEFRSFAVEGLKKLKETELQEHMLQLVQALRYEKNSEQQPVSKFLIERCVKNFELGNYFRWYLLVEIDNTPKTLFFTQVLQDYKSKCSPVKTFFIFIFINFYFDFSNFFLFNFIIILFLFLIL